MSEQIQFSVGQQYTNRKGTFTVLKVTPPTMRVRCTDGIEETLNIEIQQRIISNMALASRTPEVPSRRMVDSEASVEALLERLLHHQPLRPKVNLEPTAISVHQFVAFTRTLASKQIETLSRGQPFKVRVLDGYLEFMPSTRIARPEPFTKVEDFLNEYAATGSMQPGHYLQVTRNASYLLALLAKYLEK